MYRNVFENLRYFVDEIILHSSTFKFFFALCILLLQFDDLHLQNQLWSIFMLNYAVALIINYSWYIDSIY